MSQAKAYLLQKNFQDSEQNYSQVFECSLFHHLTLGGGGVGGVDIRHFNQEVFLTFFILGLVTAEQAAIFTNSVLQLARLQSASLDWELARV